MRRLLLVPIAAVALLAASTLAPAKPAEASHWSYCVVLAPGWSSLPFLVETANVPLLPNPKACVASNFGHTSLQPWPPGFCDFASIGVPIFQCTPPCGSTGQVEVTVNGPPGTTGFATCSSGTFTVTAACQILAGQTSCNRKENWPPPGGPLLGTSFTCALAVPVNNIGVVHCQS
jgi:hypothetical protein